jgi:uncharacterized protein (UPF0332 family)
MLAQSRLSQAKEAFEGARKNIEIGEYKIANNRAYYSVSYAMRAAFALEGVDFKRHSGIISHFQKRYIKTGIFPKEYSKIITQAEEVRTESDYEDFYVVSKDATVSLVENAEKFYRAVEDYIARYLEENGI